MPAVANILSSPWAAHFSSMRKRACSGKTKEAASQSCPRVVKSIHLQKGRRMRKLRAPLGTIDHRVLHASFQCKGRSHSIQTKGLGSQGTSVSAAVL